MEFDLVETWTHMNPLVRGVVIVLSLQALGSIAVLVDRLIVLFAGYRSSRRFAREAGPKLAAGRFEEVLAVVEDPKIRQGDLGGLIAAGLETYTKQREQGMDRERAAELTRRALERRGESTSERLHRGMNVLASTGSTAPFIGLLGTVLGILNAFRMIGQEGSGGIGTIGVAIAEALIVTGFGLMVAIPAVLMFNMLSSRLAKYEGILANASGELVDRLETSHPVRTSAELDPEILVKPTKANGRKLSTATNATPTEAAAASPA